MLESKRAVSSKRRRQLHDYVQTVLHVQLSLEPWDGEERLPLFLAQGFAFLRSDILSSPILFAIVASENDATPSELASRRDQLQEVTAGIVVFVFDHLSSYMRARLIDQEVAFVVPGNQLYIPHLALDLREYFRARPPVSASSLSPVAQVVLFRHLLTEHGTWTPSGLAKDLRYSAMSVGRAFDVLHANGIAEIEATGRSKQLVFSADRAELFEKARPLLRSPVKSSHYFRAHPLPKGFFGATLPQSLPIGGEMALSEHSMLNAPKNPHFAVGPSNWKTLRAGEFGPEVEYKEEANFSVDVWRYDPDIVTGENKADPLSLYMQFHDHPDERVAGAVNELMERLPWSQG